MRAASTRTLTNARRLRQAMTLPEVLLWRGLRGRGGEFVWRRQHPFGPYILDFYCPAVRLAVEVDGAHHEFTIGKDARRDAWLLEQGVSTYRIAASDVLADPTQPSSPSSTRRVASPSRALLSRADARLSPPASGRRSTPEPRL
jgi:very-short-patch-repair endonuclease